MATFEIQKRWLKNITIPTDLVLEEGAVGPGEIISERFCPRRDYSERGFVRSLRGRWKHKVVSDRLYTDAGRYSSQTQCCAAGAECCIG